MEEQFRSEKLESCHHSCMGILQLQPKNVLAHYYLARIALQFGDGQRACQLLELAIGYEPNRMLCYLIQIELLFQTGSFEQALDKMNQAACADVDGTDELNQLGCFFNRVDMHEKACEVFSRAEPDNTPSYENLLFNHGMSIKFTGQLDRALSLFEKTLELNPAQAAYASLVELTAKPDLMELKQKLIGVKKTFTHFPDEVKVDVYFALALCCEKLAEFEQSFTYLEKGNGLKRQFQGYRIENDQALMQAVKQKFCTKSESNFTNQKGNTTPVFILGLPRAGSTLLERMLSSHTQVETGGGEIQSFPIEFMRAARLPQLNAEALSKSGEVNFAQVAEGYLAQTHRYRAIPNGLLIDKLPYNFLYIGAIKAAFPNAKIIHISRHPLDACLSNYKQNYPVLYGFSNSLQDNAKFYVEYDKLMAYWNELYPDEIHNISYEELVSDPEQEMHSLLEYCGLEWEENCLRPELNQSSVSTASSVQVRQKINPSAVARWKQYESQLSPVIEILTEAGIDIT